MASNDTELSSQDDEAMSRNDNSNSNDNSNCNDDKDKDNDDETPSKRTKINEEEPPRRLMITKMVLENFKSYAGRQEIGPFHHCFTSVVGPNGSGKSNVIDAMLFVFGKRAKQLRLNKIRELIHKSDQCVPSFATVTVHMQEIIDIAEEEQEAARDNNDNQASPLPYRVVPNSEVILSRTAKSDNTSVYKLNGKNKQFREVAAFLKTKGIDLEHNRFLILQGEVELISMMPPKAKNEGDNDGLLEYLEDIIGSHTFVPATLEAAEKVENLTTVRQEKLNRVKAAEQETKALEAAKVEAQALLRRERDIRQQQNILYQVQRLQVQRSYAAQEQKKLELTQQLEACQQEMGLAKQELEEMAAKHVASKNEYQQVHDELVKTEQEFTAYERKDIKLRETIKHLKQKIKDLQKKMLDQEKKEQAAHEKHETAQQRIPELEQEIETLLESKVQENAKLEDVQAETRQATQQLRSELEVQTHALAPLLQDRAEKQADLDTAQTELSLVLDSTKEAQTRLLQAQQELANLDATQQAKQTEHQEKTVALRNAQSTVKQLESEDATLVQQEEQLSQRYKQVMSRSEEAKAALQAKGGPKSTPALTGILKAAKEGGPLAKMGILGRLGDLATIDVKYDVAVSNACAGYLDHIVVQTTAGAQRCLEFLRKHNLGRANFIPLDKMKKGAHDRVVETPEQAPRLLELIQPMASKNHGGIMSALFLAVGDTLVAPDLETATRWAYDYGKRWRVVTLDGKLLETSGTMQGGGKHVKKGGMTIRNARHKSAQSQQEDDGLDLDAQKLEAEAESTQGQLRSVRQRRKEIAEDLRKVKKQIKDLERLLPKLNMDIASFDSTRENLTELIPQLQEQSKLSSQDETKVEELREKVSQCQTDMKASIEQASDIEAEVSRLQKAILDAGGPRLKKHQAACDTIVQQIKDAEKALASSKVAIKSSEKAAKKAQEAKAQAGEQLEEASSSLEGTQKEFKALEEDAFGVCEAHQTVKETAAHKKAELEDLKQALEQLKNSNDRLKGKEIGLHGQMEALTNTLAEQQQKIHHWDVAIKKILKVARKDERELWEDEDQEDGDSEEVANEDESKDTEEEKVAEDDDEANDVEMKDVTEEEEVDRDTARLAASYPEYKESALDRYETEELKLEIIRLETERDALAKNANLSAIAEYRKKEADYMARVAELDEVTEQRNQVRREHEELRRKRLEMFMEGFSHITLKLKEMYQMITLGGDAELELVDSLDPFSEGIVFSVRPPKKSWKNISNLSGGEKTLSSLALVFALHHYKPTPLYVMDEIDAALDYKNVSIVANYIKERTKNAQFIIISLRNNMFELADRLVGVYKTYNCSKSIAVDPNAYGIELRQDGYSATPALRNRTNRTSGTAPRSTTKRVVEPLSPTPMAPLAS